MYYDTSAYKKLIKQLICQGILFDAYDAVMIRNKSNN